MEISGKNLPDPGSCHCMTQDAATSEDMQLADMNVTKLLDKSSNDLNTFLHAYCE